MSNTLIDKMRRARETAVEVDGHRYTVRRPTDAQALHLHVSGADFFVVARDCVVGWDLHEIDLIPGGNPEPAAFSPTLWAEYLADHSALWVPLANSAMDGYRSHAEKVGAATKN